MSYRLKEVRTSLAVGFPGEALPETLAQYCGRQHRSIVAQAAFPFEDAQFDVVLLAAEAVTERIVREVHRVLKPEGHLFFVVPEKTKKQDGFTLPDVYSIVRSGFNIVEAARPPWWHFGRGARTLSICAQKKNWRVLSNTFRPYV